MIGLILALQITFYKAVTRVLSKYNNGASLQNTCIYLNIYNLSNVLNRVIQKSLRSCKVGFFYVTERIKKPLNSNHGKIYCELKWKMWKLLNKISLVNSDASNRTKSGHFRKTIRCIKSETKISRNSNLFFHMICFKSNALGEPNKYLN